MFFTPRAPRSRRFRPALDALPSRATPAPYSVNPLDPTLVGVDPPVVNPAPDVTPMDPTLVGWDD